MQHVPSGHGGWRFLACSNLFRDVWLRFLSIQFTPMMALSITLWILFLKCRLFSPLFQ